MLGDLRTCCGMGLQRGVEPRLKAPQALVLAVTPQQPRKDNQFGYQLKGFRGQDSLALLVTKSGLHAKSAAQTTRGAETTPGSE